MLAKGQLLILTNSLYGKRPRFCSHVTDFFASPVLYPICLPSRLDSLLCGVNPCALPPLFLQFSLSPLPHSPPPVSRRMARPAPSTEPFSIPPSAASPEPALPW